MASSFLALLILTLPSLWGVSGLPQGLSKDTGVFIGRPWTLNHTWETPLLFVSPKITVAGVKRLSFVSVHLRKMDSESSHPLAGNRCHYGSQEQEPPRSPSGVAGTQSLEPSPLPPRVCSHRKLGLGVEAPDMGPGILTAGLTPTPLPSRVLAHVWPLSSCISSCFLPVTLSWAQSWMPPSPPALQPHVAAQPPGVFGAPPPLSPPLCHSLCLLQLSSLATLTPPAARPHPSQVAKGAVSTSSSALPPLGFARAQLSCRFCLCALRSGLSPIQLCSQGQELHWVPPCTLGLACSGPCAHRGPGRGQVSECVCVNK